MNSVGRDQARKPRFYVVQFRDLPYDRIDNYVCVPHTWVTGPSAAHPKVVVAYPNDEAPSKTRKRVQRKEKKGHQWRYYTAVVKYEADFYDDAELWIVQRNDFGPSKKQNLKDTLPKPALNKEDKPELKKSMKRPAMSEPTEQLNNKRPKPETAVRTVDIQTNSNLALHSSVVQQLDGLQNLAAQQHYLDQSPNGSHGTNQRTSIKEHRVNEIFLQSQRNPVAKQPSKYPSRFDQSENQDNVKQVPRDSVGTNCYDNCPIKSSIPSTRDLQRNASIMLQFISERAQQKSMQPNHQNIFREHLRQLHASYVATGSNTITRSMAAKCSMSASKRPLASRDIATGSNTIDRPMAGQCSMSANKTPLASRDVATGSNTIDRPMAAQCSMSANKTPLARRDVATETNTIGRPMAAKCSMSASKRPLASRDVATGSNTIDRPMAAQSSMSASKTPLARRDVATGSNTIDRPIAAQCSISVSKTSMADQYSMPASKAPLAGRDVATGINTTDRPTVAQIYTSTSNRQLSARNEDVGSNTTNRLMVEQNSTATSKRQLPAKYETAGSNPTDRPMVAENVSTSTKHQLHEIVLKPEMFDNMIDVYSRMKSNLQYISAMYENLQSAMSKMSGQFQSLLEYRNQLDSIRATYPADNGSGAT